MGCRDEESIFCSVYCMYSSEGVLQIGLPVESNSNALVMEAGLE